MPTDEQAGHEATRYGERLAQWALALRYEDIPPDVVAATKLRILDIAGLSLAGSLIPQGRFTRAAIRHMGSGKGSHLIGYGDETSPALAAIVNGTTSHAQEYCDTHNETFTHPSSPTVSAVLPLAESLGTSGRETIAAVAVGIELACRIAVAAPGMFHKHGFQTTSVNGIFGIAHAASRLLGLELPQAMHAAGICGTQAAGLLECFADGTWSKSFSPGWAGHSAICAALLAREGFTGPATVLEGRWGLFQSHVQDPGYAFGFERMTAGLGDIWESRNISFKPYPSGHFNHPFLDAALQLYGIQGVRPEHIERIVCPVADYMVPLICEPAAQKMKPASDWHARLSLQYSVAEALYFGHLGAGSYSQEKLSNPEVLALASKVTYVVDATAPPRGTYKGWVIVETKDGRRLEHSPRRPWGSLENPMTPLQVMDKFRGNASLVLQTGQVEQLMECVLALDAAEDLAAMMRICAPR